MNIIYILVLFVLMVIGGLFLIYLFSDEQLDKVEKRMIEKIVKERLEEK